MALSRCTVVFFLALALVANTLQPSGATSADAAFMLTATADQESPAPSPGSLPHPASCLSSFMEMMPCMDFFTDASVSAPSSACCKGLQKLVDDAAICLCNAMNGDIDQLLPATTDFNRVADLPATCGVALPIETLSKCYTEPVPPIMPPSPAA